MLTINYPKETFHHQKKTCSLEISAGSSQTWTKVLPSQYCTTNVQDKGMDNNLLSKKENLSVVSKDKDLKKLNQQVYYPTIS